MIVIDLSFSLTNETEVYPGDPKIKIKKFTVKNENPVNLTEITLGSHSGTHVDAPNHFIEKGKTVDEIHISKFFGEAIILETEKYLIDNKISKKIIDENSSVINGAKGLIFKTGWSRKWGQKCFYQDFPQLDEETAEKIVKTGVNFVGIDSPSIGSPEVHRTLLSGEVVIFEALNLSNLTKRRIMFAAFPLPISGADGSPVRAVALVNNLEKLKIFC